MSTIGRQTAVQTSVAASATSVTLFTATSAANRRIITNDADQVLYVSFSGAASTTNFIYKLAVGDTRELTHPVFAGAITGIWAGAPTGAARLASF